MSASSNTDVFSAPPAEEPKEKPAPKKKAGATIFLWPTPLTKRVIVLEQKKEQMTDKGAVPVFGSGRSIAVEYGVYETQDKSIISSLKKHPSFGHERRDRAFREASDEETNIIKMLKDSKIGQDELLRRMRAIMSAQDPNKKITRG